MPSERHFVNPIRPRSGMSQSTMFKVLYAPCLLYVLYTPCLLCTGSVTFKVLFMPCVCYVLSPICPKSMSKACYQYVQSFESALCVLNPTHPTSAMFSFEHKPCVCYALHPNACSLLYSGSNMSILWPWYPIPRV